MSDARANHRVAYFNGKIVPERDVVIPFRDRGFKYGDAAFDMTRTFQGRPFKLPEHIARFYRSLRYLRIDPGLSPDEIPPSAIASVRLQAHRFFTTDPVLKLLTEGQRQGLAETLVRAQGSDFIFLMAASQTHNDSQMVAAMNEVARQFEDEFGLDVTKLGIVPEQGFVLRVAQ